MKWLRSKRGIGSDKHDSDHARLLLALYLVQSPLNKIRCRLIQEARNARLNGGRFGIVVWLLGNEKGQ
ncbi:hypothetical protein CUMW_050170 [Citrus unshiu]|nr:hypothetical protein CUMW_050170 [Citrus unshiu]